MLVRLSAEEVSGVDGWTAPWARCQVTGGLGRAGAATLAAVARACTRQRLQGDAVDAHRPAVRVAALAAWKVEWLH